MPEKPSWMTSTTSQILVGAIAFYGLGALVLVWKGSLTNLEPFQWLINVLLPIYAVRKGVESGKNGNGVPHDPAQPTP